MPSPLSISLTLLLALHLSPALAVPNVTAIPLDTKSCRDWPGWTPAAGPDATGNLQFQVEQADDSATNGLVTTTKTTTYASGATETDVVLTLRSSRSFAKVVYRCIDGAVKLGYGDYTPLSIANDSGNAHITLGGGYKPGVYVHEIDGVRQPGVYLGAQNQTTWGFRFINPEACGDVDAYEVKLLGLPVDPANPPGAAYPVEFRGFLKVVEY